MYIVVIGLGEVGKHLLAEFDREGHDVVAIDASSAAVQYAEDHFDVMTLHGYGASHDLLSKAGVDRAELVVAVTDNDEVNLIAALAAKQLGARRVIARAQGAHWAERAAGVRYGLLGVDVVINPRVLVAQELARVARSHGACEVVDLAQSRVELVQMDLHERTRGLGKPLSTLDLPRKTLIAAIVRASEVFVPGGADVLAQGDRIYLIGHSDDVVEAEDLFSSRREAGRVCIVGGGVIGRAMAASLVDQGVQVTVFEQNREVAEHLSADLRPVTVVHGDGTDGALLEEEEVETFDLFAAVTAADEVNLMAALLAKRLGVQRTAAVVQRANYLPIYRQLGVDIVLSPRTVASDHVLRYARIDSLHSLHVLEDGQAEVVELHVPPDCAATGMPLRRLDVPRGALVAAIVRGDEVVIPRGEDEVRAGDHVIVMTTRQARPAVQRLFRVPSRGGR
ncbi:MAG: Trk system potassium transporter TrkA [Myxococcota bacterium]